MLRSASLDSAGLSATRSVLPSVVAISLLGGAVLIGIVSSCGRIGYEELSPGGQTRLGDRSLVGPGLQSCIGNCVCETGGCDIVCEGDCLVSCPPGNCTMECLPHFKCNLECNTGRWGASGNGITFRGGCP